MNKCSDAQIAASVRWQKENKQKHNEATKRWRDKNKDKVAEYKHLYNGRYKERQRAYYHANKDRWKSEHYKKVAKIYNEANKEKRFAKKMAHKRAWWDIIVNLNMSYCWECGYSKCFAAIEFHHKDPSTKRYVIGTMFQLKVTEDRIDELKSCVPLCANCHRERHFHEGTLFESLRIVEVLRRD
jgi:hypothetical protein